MDKKPETPTLLRYTSLPFVIDFLASRELVLPSPVTWDDRNDSYYLEQYAKDKEVDATYALCLTETRETYHHWRVFSHGPAGICIWFKREELLVAVSKAQDVRAEPVQYRGISQLHVQRPTVDELPFLKRDPYRDEKEFRLFAAPQESPTGGVYRLPVPIKAIERLTLSPWLPRSTAEPIKKLLKSMTGCSNLRIYRSTLVENDRWKKYGSSPA